MGARDDRYRVLCPSPEANIAPSVPELSVELLRTKSVRAGLRVP